MPTVATVDRAATVGRVAAVGSEATGEGLACDTLLSCCRHLIASESLLSRYQSMLIVEWSIVVYDPEVICEDRRLKQIAEVFSKSTEEVMKMSTDELSRMVM